MMHLDDDDRFTPVTQADIKKIQQSIDDLHHKIPRGAELDGTGDRLRWIARNLDETRKEVNLLGILVGIAIILLIINLIF